MLPNTCELCGREMKRGTTRHHLIPRACHRRTWFKRRYSKSQLLTTVELCRDCHGAVHDLVPDEIELGKHFHTLELLREHPPITKFLTWVRKQK